LKIATVGDNCVDAYKSLNKEFFGGNSLNVAVHCARLGVHAAYVGAIGDDEYGKKLLEELTRNKVDTSHVKILHGTTAVTQVELVNGDRVFGDYDEGVLALFKLDEKDIDFLAAQDIVASALWGMVETELGWIKKKGNTAIAFDFATKLEDTVIEKAIYDVDYAFFSYDGDDQKFIKDYMKGIYAKGPKQVITTLGDKGSIVWDGREFTSFGIIPCKVVDTMGAGDSYIAAYLKSIGEGKSISESMALGAANSSKVITYQGAW
jgi:fructoselysine 6-kinase